MMPSALAAIGFIFVGASVHDPSARLVWLGCAVVTLAACSSGLPLLALRRLRIVKDAPERLAKAVRVAGQRVGHTPRVCFVLPWGMLNALAFPLLDRVAFTSAAVARLSDSDLEAIAAHEIGHLREPKSVLALRFALGMLWIVPLAVFAVYGNSRSLLVAFLGVVTVRVLVGSALQRMEVRADAIAKHGEGEGGDYARALERLHELNMIPAVLFGLKTHPSLYDRMVAAGVQPQYPRPSPPSRLRGMLLALGGLGAGHVLPTLVLIGVLWLPRLANFGAETHMLFNVAIAGRGGDVGELATLRSAAGRIDEARLLFRVARELGDEDPKRAAQLVMLEVRAGRCEDARRVLDSFDPTEGLNQARAAIVQRAVARCGLDSARSE